MNADIRHLIAKIRERPGIYIGNYSVVRLRSFLDGYRFARAEAGESSYSCELLDRFQQVVQERYSITSSHGWDNILAFMAGSEAKALDLFWQLWDEYIAEADRVS